MTTMVAFDLDRTMIYSRRARKLGTDEGPSVCVEIHDGKEASFMTAAAAAGLVALAETTLAVPVTTRVADQYRRVVLPGRPPRYSVTTNGGALLVDGRADRGWTRRVERELAGSFPLEAVWEQVGHICHPDFTVMLRNASGLFCYAVVRPSLLPTGFVDDVSGWAAERGWRTSLQGRKLYWVPERLTKGAAVAEVAEREGCELVLAAGDSLLDVDLLLGADRGIHPRHGELHEQGWSGPNVVSTQSSGIAAGTEIVRWFAAQAAQAA